MNTIEHEEVFKQFIESYLVENQVDTSKISRKTYYRDKVKPQFCRFCSREFPSTTFSTDAHFIPKFLGSKYLLSSFECDECNAKFKTYENDLANFIGPVRSVLGISGKSKNPKFKSEGISIEQEEDGTIMFNSDEVVKQIKEGERRIHVKTVMPKFTPSNVYKGLLKMALGLVRESELINFEDTFRFLLGEDSEDLLNRLVNGMNVIRIFVPGPKIPEFPIVHLIRRKNDNINLPEKIFVLHIRNFKFQLILPFNKKDDFLDGKEIDVPMIPVILNKEFVAKYGDYQFESIDLSGREIIENKEIGFAMDISNVVKY